MIYLYQEESDSGDIYYEVYKVVIGEGWDEQYVRTLQNDNEFQLYLDILRAQGLDFVIHTQEEYDEYHVALPSV